MTIRGIIFDIGDVLLDMRWDVAWELEDRYGLERMAIKHAFYEIDEYHALEHGRCDAEAWRLAAQRALEEMAGRSLPALYERWRETWGPVRANFAVARALRPAYRMGVLSNGGSSPAPWLREHDALDLFDDIVCSAEAGVRKPDAAVFRLAAERLGLSTEECLFIDDNARNVDGARATGMAAVKFRLLEGDRLAEQLAEYGIVAPAPA
jgi:HAD superfamily hydrolase (TIGR01509 family)